MKVSPHSPGRERVSANESGEGVVISLATWVEEKKLADLVAPSSTVLEAKNSPGTHPRLEELRRQIRAGTYKIDSLRLAQKLMDKVFDSYELRFPTHYLFGIGAVTYGIPSVKLDAISIRTLGPNCADVDTNEGSRQAGGSSHAFGVVPGALSTSVGRGHTRSIVADEMTPLTLATVRVALAGMLALSIHADASKFTEQIFCTLSDLLPESLITVLRAALSNCVTHDGTARLRARSRVVVGTANDNKCSQEENG